MVDLNAEKLKSASSTDWPGSILYRTPYRMIFPTLFGMGRSLTINASTVYPPLGLSASYTHGNGSLETSFFAKAPDCLGLCSQEENNAPRRPPSPPEMSPPCPTTR